jgi:hypothetical protein
MEITERHETQMAPFSAGVDLLASHSSHNAFVVPFDAKLKQLAIHTTHEILKESWPWVKNGEASLQWKPCKMQTPGRGSHNVVSLAVTLQNLYARCIEVHNQAKLSPLVSIYDHLCLKHL